MSTRTALLLALREGPGFGLDLIRRLARRTGNRVRLSEARVYPTLGALETEGLVTATRVSPRGQRGGRSRTYYDLTVGGVLCSGEDQETLGRMAAATPAGRAPLRSDVRRMADRLARMGDLSELAADLRAAMLQAQGKKANRARQ